MTQRTLVQAELGETLRIDAVGGVIDPNTGSVQMRASFPNAHRILPSAGHGKSVLL